MSDPLKRILDALQYQEQHRQLCTAADVANKKHALVESEFEQALNNTKATAEEIEQVRLHLIATYEQYLDAVLLIWNSRLAATDHIDSVLKEMRRDRT